LEHYQTNYQIAVGWIASIPMILLQMDCIHPFDLVSFQDLGLIFLQDGFHQQCIICFYASLKNTNVLNHEKLNHEDPKDTKVLNHESWTTKTLRTQRYWTTKKPLRY